jgi:hypothetical protein
MSGDIRTALIAAGVGLVISILSALIGGVPFGDFLIRALVTVLLAGGLTIVVSQLIKRFLPELMQAAPKKDSEDEAIIAAGAEGPDSSEGQEVQSPGTTVNIVMPGGNEEPATGTVTEVAEDSSVAPKPDYTPLTMGDQEVDRLEPLEEGGVGNSSHESVSQPEAMSPSSSSVSNSTEEISEEDDQAEPELVQEVNEDGNTRNANPPQQNTGDNEFYEGVENLPDIAGFEGTFQSNENTSMIESDEGEDGADFSPTGAEEDSFGPSYSEPQTHNQDGMDPVMIAKAIQTALKKDS